MDKNIIIRRLQSAKHLLSDDDILDLDCCHLALGNIEEALEELEKNEAPTAQEGPERPSEAHTSVPRPGIPYPDRDMATPPLKPVAQAPTFFPSDETIIKL